LTDRRSHPVRRGVRALRYGFWRLRSDLVLAWYRTMFPGLRVGRGVRLAANVYINIVEGARADIGDNVYLDRRVDISVEGYFSIGANSYVGVGTVITAAERIEIGEDALIAEHVTIRDQDHRFADVDTPYRLQGRETAPIIVGRNVWIGAKATLLRGISIGNNCIIGANAVVKSSLGEGSIAAGVPAKVVRMLGAGGGPAQPA